MKIELIKDSGDIQRLDKYISDLNHEELYSRSQIEKLIRQGNILVNGKREKKSFLLQEGDHIEVDLAIPAHMDLEPQDIPLNIVYEDEFFTVVNKASGLTVHPAQGNPSGTLVNALLYHYGENLSRGTSSERPGIVHRLDKDTSGLLIIARTDRIHALLSSMFRFREIKKTYLAISCGIPQENEGTINTNLDRSTRDRRKMSVSETGKNAITHYKIAEYFHYCSLLEIGLETGRTHQIRVHLSYLNCPVLGDRLYSGTKRELNLLPHELGKRLQVIQNKYAVRQMLHAWKLEFQHPVTKEILCLEAPLPDDFSGTLTMIRKLDL